MKQKLREVYIPVNGETELGVCYFSNFEEWTLKEGVEEKQLITFTKEEYNQHIEDVIKDALETANKKALIDRKPTGEGDDSDEETSKSFDGDLGYEEYIPVEYTVNKESITNTLNDTLNKYKL